jgi:hypothetical protein
MLALSVPSLDPAFPHPVETRPKALSVWLARLPYASPLEAAQQLVTALYALNRRPLDETVRAGLLALFRPVVARVGASLETLLAESGVPPHARQRQLGALLRELHIEHGIGYKHLLLAPIRHRFGRPRHTADALARLMAALRDLQTACQLTRTLPLPGLWQELHALYAFAQTANLDDRAADDAPAPGLAYRQSLLMALADPPRMGHADILHTRGYLDRHAALTQLARAPVPAHRGFAIRTDDDAAPSLHTDNPPPAGLWLDTEALCRRLHESLLQLRGGATPDSIGLAPETDSEFARSLCKHLLRHWSNGAVRTYKRYATPGRTARTVAGVSAIHRLLEAASRKMQRDPGDADEQAIHVVEPALAAPAPASTVEWISHNDSAAGLGLSGAPDAPLNLKVGDALAVRVGDAAAWSLGVIRWIRMRDARQVEFGVERLAPNIQPAWVRPLRGGKKAEPALFVPGLAALKQHDRLLLPRHLYQVGMDAELWYTSHLYMLTFGQRFEHTPSFDLIDFTIFADVQT